MVPDLGVPLTHLERATPIVSGFLLGYLAAIPLFGPLSDARGRAAVYLGALALFAAGSVVTATADDLARVVAGRALQGFAGGALVPVSLALVADLCPRPAQRALVLGVVAGAQEVGSLAGPVYGAAVSQWLADQGAWRAVFWLNLPLAALCAGLFVLAWRRSAPTSPRGARVDWVGALSLALALTLLVVALYPSNPAAGALNADAVPLLVGSGLALAVFLRTRRGRPPAAWAGVAVNTLVGAALVAALAEVPVLGSTLLGQDQMGSALLLARFLLGVPTGALVGGLLAGGHRRLPAAAGMLLSAGCYWLLSGVTGLTGALPWVLFGCGFGFGLVIAPVTAAILERASAQEHGAAASLAVLGRTGGMVAGFAVLAAYGFHRFYSEFARCPRPGVQVLPLPVPVDVACALGAARDQFHDIFLGAALLCVTAAVLSLGLTDARRAL